MAETKKPVKVIKAGDMSPETKALPDETRPTPKGTGEDDMGPIKDPKKGAMEGALKGIGGKALGMKKGGSASARADGCAIRGKTRA